MKPELWGTVTDNFHLNDIGFKCRILMEPSSEYFRTKLHSDVQTFDKIILFNGLEPPDINDIKSEILEHCNLINTIYTFDDDIIDMCPNASPFVFGSSWVLCDREGNKIETKSEFYDFYNIKNKKYKISFIKSPKNILEGHKLRHLVMLNDFKGEIFIPNNYIQCKIPLFTDSMFHLCIENSRHNNYFTEKLIDCFISKTIPIYWGCPNISKYFNLDGMIIVNNIDDIQRVVHSLTMEDYYSRIDAVIENFKLSQQYAFFWDRINKYIEYEECKFGK